MSDTLLNGREASTMGDFGWAAAALVQGRRVQREAWAAKGIWLLLAPSGVTTLPLIIVRRSSGATASWQPCHNDLLATDWTVKEAPDG
jgi:hypothetical protein